MPRQAPAVFAPATFAGLAAVVDDGVPQAVGLGLVVGGDLEREGFAVLELRAAVQADAGDADDGECNREHVSLLASGVVGGRAEHLADGAVGEGGSVEVGGLDGAAVKPQAQGVFGGHGVAPASRGNHSAWPIQLKARPQQALPPPESSP